MVPGLAVIDLDIPAGDPEVQFTRTVRNWSDQDVTLGSVTGHMHLLGKRLKVEVVRADGAEECALELPEWDFEWQQAYQLPDDDRITLAPGDGLRLSCTYDNSAENQPVVNGEQQEPRDVTWGEGSLDEMCLTYLGVIEDFSPTAPTPDSACPSSDGCLADCAADDLDCLLTCETVRAPASPARSRRLRRAARRRGGHPGLHHRCWERRPRQVASVPGRRCGAGIDLRSLRPAHAGQRVRHAADCGVAL